MFARHAPQLLARYDAYYETLTLKQRELTPTGRETVWAALQLAAREAHGSIHLQRGVKAGMGTPEFADAVAIAAAVEAWPALVYSSTHWAEWTPADATTARYLAIFEAARGNVPRDVAEITAVPGIGAATAAAAWIWPPSRVSSPREGVKGASRACHRWRSPASEQSAVMAAGVTPGTAWSQAATTAPATSAAKKDQITKLLSLQAPGIEQLATQIAQQPAIQLMQQAGAVLQRVTLTTQEPVSDSEETLCDGRQEATARYRWRSRSVTFSNVTAAGTDCTTGDPLRFRCTTTTVRRSEELV
jgi:hypothetical protein